MADRPRLVPVAVQDAFGLVGAPVILPGGEGRCVRAGDAVLKPVDDVVEATWSADLLARVIEDGFRVARPLRSHDGSWVVDGWSAAAFVDGHAGPAGRWEELLAAGRAFHHALREETRPEFLAQRSHRWAVADRVAWGEASAEPVRSVQPFLDELMGRLGPDVEQGLQLVHGDLSGNVLFAPGLPPAIIDLSAYWREPEYAAAIAAVDGTLWFDAGDDVLNLLGRGHRSTQHLVRALIFRLVALNEQSRFDARVLDQLPLFAAAADLIGSPTG